jgi:hypothetical protein
VDEFLDFAAHVGPAPCSALASGEPPATPPSDAPLLAQEGTASASSRAKRPHPATKETEAPAGRIWAAWLEERARFTSRGSPKLDAKRRKRVCDRLSDGYDVDDLIQAARGIWRSEWHRSEGQTDLELALRDAAHVDRFIRAYAEAPSGAVVLRTSPPPPPEDPDDPVVPLGQDPRFRDLLTALTAPAQEEPRR